MGFHKAILINRNGDMGIHIAIPIIRNGDMGTHGSHSDYAEWGYGNQYSDSG